MSKIMIRGEFPIHPGKLDQAKAAAHSLHERVLREDKGVLLYEFFVDDAGQTMAITEAYVDEPSLLNHINASDFTQIFATLDFSQANLQIHGALSADMLAKLGAIAGPFQLFGPI